MENDGTEDVHVIEDDPAEEKRKDRLDAAIREYGEPQPEVEPSPPRAPGSRGR